MLQAKTNIYNCYSVLGYQKGHRKSHFFALDIHIVVVFCEFVLEVHLEEAHFLVH